MKFKKEEFWRYAYSDLIDNRNRAAFGEFIVAKAVGATETPYSSWESYDIKSPDGIKIEVKTSAYIQTWKQEKLSIPTFDISKKYGWVGETSEWDNVKDRQANVYVFCLHLEKDKLKQLTPENSENWLFYVVSTNLINEKLADQKSLRISTLEDFLGIQPIQYENLKSEIIKVYNSTN